MKEDSEEIFFEIGEASFNKGLSAQNLSRQEAIDKGVQWLSNRKKEICKVIRTEKVQYIFKGDNNGHDEQIRLIIDVLISYKFGIPPNVLGKAIIILGETWFCEH